MENRRSIVEMSLHRRFMDFYTAREREDRGHMTIKFWESIVSLKLVANSTCKWLKFIDFLFIQNTEDDMSYNRDRKVKTVKYYS